jgi:hypothetical protein
MVITHSSVYKIIDAFVYRGTVANVSSGILWIMYMDATGVEGVVRGPEGIHLVDRCILTRLE